MRGQRLLADTEALALNLAELDGVAHEGADGPVLDEGYEVVSRKWRYEEDEEDCTLPERQGPPRGPKPDKDHDGGSGLGCGAAFCFSSVRSRRRSGRSCASPSDAPA